MLKHELNWNAVFTLPSSNSLRLGHKWRKEQSNVHEGNVARQQKLQLEGLNGDTSHEDVHVEEDEDVKEEGDRCFVSSGQLASSGHRLRRRLVTWPECPLEMQSGQKPSPVNLSPANGESRGRRIDANACALRHGKCDDECKVVMTVDLGKVEEKEPVQLEEDEEKRQSTREGGRRSEPTSSSFTQSTDAIVSNCMSTQTTGPQLEVKCDCLSATVSDKSDECNSEDIRYFMRTFVHAIFAGKDISLEDKAKFGQLCRQPHGRLWFTRFIDEQRASHMQVDEVTFYSLVQFFAIALFECSEDDDFTPAKSIMNMSFTYYTMSICTRGTLNKSNSNNNNNNNNCIKIFVYECLKDQPIWKSMRFWTAAFFLSMQSEIKRSQSSHMKHSEVTLIEKNIAFGQLGTFTHNMRALGLPKSFAIDFLQKQASIAGLGFSEADVVVKHIESLFD